MTANGVSAACHSLNCQYQYENAPGTVSSFTFDQNKGNLVISGTSLPAESDIDTILFARSECRITSATSSSISCTLVREPTCGDFVPILRSVKGKFPNSAASQAVTCNIASVTNLKKLNVLGGDKITFKGTNFPQESKDNTVIIKFNDAQET